MLPVHAADVGGGQRLLDVVDVTYAPSARVLHAAAVADRGPPRRLVGVAAPHPCEPPLPWASREVAAAARLFPGEVQVVPSLDATTDTVLRAFVGATHVHFAGHGRFDPQEPLDSALELAGGERLTVRRLLDTRALDGVRLVVASACSSASTDMTRLPDEALGLPAGLVQAGAAAVVGTLWEVNDRAAALLVTRFLATTLRGEPGTGGPPLPPGVALAAAQRWMAGAQAAEIEAFAADVGLGRRAARTTARGGPGGEIADIAPPDAAPYADPRHWAAFVLVGDGS